jgi:hypothetical protein
MTMTLQKTLVTMLNDRHRLMFVPSIGGVARAWVVQRLDGENWIDDFVVRSADMLRWYLVRIAEITEEAAAIVAGLPDRVDFPRPDEPRRGYLRKRSPAPVPASPVAQPEPVISVQPTAAKPMPMRRIEPCAAIRELARDFIQWRELRPGGRYRDRR